jgi:type IV secretion system protein VirD4
VTALALIGAALVAALLVAERLGERSRQVPSARWASWWALRALRLRRAAPGRLVLGRQGGTLIAAEPLASAIVLAPTQSQKTTGLAIPALLEWPGPVLATSIKTDLVRATIARRGALGEAMVYDPSQATGLASVKATPLAACRDWQGALRVASWLCGAARPGSGRLADGDFWFAAAEKLLAPLLWAAAVSGAQIGDVVGWLDAGAEAEPEVTRLLRRFGPPEALAAWGASWNRDERQRASIYTTAETVLAAYADPRVAASAARAEYLPNRLLGGANTLYLCAPAHEQARLRPLFAALVRELIGEVYERSAASGRPLEPPLLLVLDEAANIAPIPNLDELASSGAGQGIQLLTVFQDLAQVRTRYGPERARTILANHRARLFGSGICDPETLDYVRRVVGPGEFRQRSDTRGERDRRSATTSSAYRDLAPAQAVREARPGTALLLYGHLPAARIALRPWYEDRRLRALSEGSEGKAEGAIR